MGTQRTAGAEMVRLARESEGMPSGPRPIDQVLPYARGVIRAVVGADALLNGDTELADAQAADVCQQLGSAAAIIDRAARLLLVGSQRDTKVYEDPAHQLAGEQVERWAAQDLALTLAAVDGVDGGSLELTEADWRLLGDLRARPDEGVLYRMPRRMVLRRLLGGVDPAALSTN